LAQFPSVNKDYIDDQLAARWDTLLKVRGEVSKALELARCDKVIGHSLDADVSIFAPEKLYGFLKTYLHELRSLFIVSKVNLFDNEEGNGEFKSQEVEGLGISVAQAPGEKCERCWTYHPTVGDSREHPTACRRCVEVIEGS
jgi:isoleucyl-tRNA synthetase